MKKTKVKKSILRFAEEGLINHLNISREEARKHIESSNLAKSIDRAPDVVAHYSQEQLIYSILK